jgi:hypothetical protein
MTQDAPSIPPGWHFAAPSPEKRAMGRGASLSYATMDGFMMLTKTATAFTLTVTEYGSIYPSGVPYRATWIEKAGHKLELEMREVAHRMLMTALGPHNDPQLNLFQIFAKGSELTTELPSAGHRWTISVPPPPDELNANFALSP